MMRNGEEYMKGKEAMRDMEKGDSELDGGKVGPFIKHSVGFRHKFLAAVEIERESNRGKLETFRAIKSDLIFNKFTFHGARSALALVRGLTLTGGRGAGGKVIYLVIIKLLAPSSSSSFSATCA